MGSIISIRFQRSEMDLCRLSCCVGKKCHADAYNLLYVMVLWPLNVFFSILMHKLPTTLYFTCFQSTRLKTTREKLKNQSISTKEKRCAFLLSLFTHVYHCEREKKMYVPIDQKTRATEQENYNRRKSIAANIEEKHDQFPYVEDELKCSINQIAPKKV